jgi:membrane-bound metal-dependent hydrolase YbcI (DUF457 family)
MVDALTHVFLPLTAAYVLRRDLFPAPGYLLLGGVGLLSDFDKFLGVPGLLHSLVTLGPLCLAILAAEQWVRGELEYAPLVAALLLSHLLLDVVDGGPVPLLSPFVETGIGLQYPVTTAFGRGPLGLAFDGPIVTLRTTAPRPGFNTYGFVDGVGVANALLFATVYLGREREGASD